MFPPVNNLTDRKVHAFFYQRSKLTGSSKLSSINNPTERNIYVFSYYLPYGQRVLAEE